MIDFLFVTEETQFCVNGGLHPVLNQCKKESYANPLYVVQEGPDIMRLEPDQPGAQSDSHPQRQAPPMPLQFDCGISKMVGPKKQDFCIKVT